MRILVDKNNPFVVEAFSDYGEVRALNTLEFTREAVREAEALVIRSETKITNQLLQESRVRFVGSATIGTDHVDESYLAQRQIGFASAPGCNANSVSEYIVAALLRHADRHGISLVGKTLGVVGVGNVGGKVVRRAETLGLSVLQNDPPLARKTGLKHFVSLDDLMESDIVTLHVPLTSVGPDATHHLFDAHRIKRMKRGSVLINTARGAVVDTRALNGALRTGHLAAALLDVWENEPAIDVELLSMVELGTSHIAGYSFDGKLNAVRQIHDAMGKFFQMPRTWTVPASLPPPKVAEMRLESGPTDPFGKSLWHVVRSCYDIDVDDKALRELLGVDPAERSRFFRRLRAEYPVRREFQATKILLSPDQPSLRERLAALGFSV